MASAGADWLHVDVMDGHFVPPITIGADVVKGLAKVTSLPLDVHLMVRNPESQVDLFMDAGAWMVTVHAEATVHLDRLLNHIRKRGFKAGVALNPATPVLQIEAVLHLVDLVLVMSVNPGYGGQSFIDYTLDKIADLRQRCVRRGLTPHIQVDGGVKVDNYRRVVEAGADVLVAGTAVFHAQDPAAVIRQMKSGSTS